MTVIGGCGIFDFWQKIYIFYHILEHSEIEQEIRLFQILFKFDKNDRFVVSILFSMKYVNFMKFEAILVEFENAVIVIPQVLKISNF